jgi:cell division inhibitor SulA
MLAMLTDNVDSMHCALSTGTYEGGKGWLEDAIEATDTLLKRAKGVE